MFRKSALARLLLFAVLQLGAMTGIAMTPEQIEELMNLMTRTKVQYVIKTDDPPE